MSPEESANALGQEPIEVEAEVIDVLSEDEAAEGNRKVVAVIDAEDDSGYVRDKTELARSETREKVEEARSKEGAATQETGSSFLDEQADKAAKSFGSLKDEVSHAAKLRNEKKGLKSLQKKLDQDQAEYDDNVFILQNFDDVIAEQREIAKTNDKAAEDKGSLAADLGRQIKGQEDIISRLLKQQAEELAPFERALEEAKTNFTNAKRDHSSKLDALSDVKQQYSKANKALQNTREEEEKAAFQQRMEELLAQMEPLTAAAEEATEAVQATKGAKKDADARYSNMKQDHKKAKNDAEAILQKLKAQQKDAEEAKKKAERLAAQARERIDHATYVNEHPEETEQLGERIAEAKEQVAASNATVEQMEEVAAGYRKKSLRAKVILGVVAVVVIAIIVAVVAFSR